MNTPERAFLCLVCLSVLLERLLESLTDFGPLARLCSPRKPASDKKLMFFRKSIIAGSGQSLNRMVPPLLDTSPAEERARITASTSTN